MVAKFFLPFISRVHYGCGPPLRGEILHPIEGQGPRGTVPPASRIAPSSIRQMRSLITPSVVSPVSPTPAAPAAIPTRHLVAAGRAAASRATQKRRAGNAAAASESMAAQADCSRPIVLCSAGDITVGRPLDALSSTDARSTPLRQLQKASAARRC